MSQFDVDENVVWSRMVDQDAWEVLVRVGRVFMFEGTLEVWDHATSTRIHVETVPLPIEALFGKEIPDWESWQTKALSVIDSRDSKMEDEYVEEPPC